MNDKDATVILKQFPANYMRMQEAIQALRDARLRTDVKAQRYGGFRNDSGHSDPTAKINEHVFWLQDIVKQLEPKIIPVLRLRSALKLSEQEDEREMFLVLELHYFNGMRVEDIALHLQKSERTIWRLMHRVLQELKREMRNFSKGQ